MFQEIPSEIHWPSSERKQMLIVKEFEKDH